MTLIIVESPTKARTLSKFLGGDYAVEATTGHIKDLPKSKLSVDVDNNFDPNYEVVERQAKTIAKLKKSAKNSDKVYLATDPDREGEAISQHVQEILVENGYKPENIKRISFHEITKSAVEHAIEDPNEVNHNLVNAQIARRVLDRLVGYKLSPLLWKKVRRGLSAGRVQTVAVRLIVEKEDEIKAFKPEEYWEIYCDTVTAKNKKLQIALTKFDDSAIKIADKKRAKEVVTDLEAAKYLVADVKNRETKKKPYAPYTTSTMTQAGASIFGWSAKRTMSVAQKLYEAGHITYHRTDSVNVSKEALMRLRMFIEDKYGEEYVHTSERVYKTKSKSAQEAHEAIRPTDVNTNLEAQNSKIDANGQKLYNLIWKRFVSSQMADSISDTTSIIVHTDNNYELRASGQVMKFEGWRKVSPVKKDEDPLLPHVEKGEDLSLTKVNSDQKFTQPPPRFNEASIIKTLEKLGIGRPSTYAPIIHTIQMRNYVEKKDGRFYATPIGVAVNTFLVGNFPDVFDYGFSAEMESDLDKVAEGALEWRKSMSVFWEPFVKKLDDVEEKSKRIKIETEKLNKKCPTCKKEVEDEKERGELVIRIGRFGKFISCSHFPDCKHTEKFLQKINMKCPDCEKGDVVVKKTRKGRSFFGCSRYPKCEFASWKDPSKDKAVKD